MGLKTRLCLALMSLHACTYAETMEWTSLPALPDPEGFAGAYAGTLGDGLVMAGGANIAEPGRWSESFTKIWSAAAFHLPSPKGQWQRLGDLPQAGGYGVSFSTRAGVLLVGGGNAHEHFSRVLRIRLKDGELVTENLPPLPKPCAYMAGAVVGSVAYIVGGIERPDSTQAMDSLWALNLDGPTATWEQRPPCPGGGRILPVASAVGDEFLVLSGAALKPGANGKAVRTYLKDAWSYSEAKGWRALVDLPRAAVAAASPAPSRAGEVYIISGDDGLNVDFQPLPDHPGFPKDSLAYHRQENRWRVIPGLPFSRATVPVVEWAGSYAFLNGEVRPRVRTPKIDLLTIHP